MKKDYSGGTKSYEFYYRERCGMFKIGEFSKLTQVSIRMLHYYDEMGLLKPSSVDKQNNYRLYSAEQILELNKILFLRDLGFSVKEMRHLLENWNQFVLLSELEEKEEKIEQMITQERQKLSRLRKTFSDIQNGSGEKNYEVTIRNIPSYQVLSLRQVIPDYFAEGMLWKDLDEAIQDNHWQIKERSYSFAIYHDSEYKETSVDVEICVTADISGKSNGIYQFKTSEPIEQAACFMVIGPFENIAPSFLSLAHWLEQHEEYVMQGKSRQAVIKGPWNESDPAHYLTEIQIPIIRRIGYSSELH